MKEGDKKPCLVELTASPEMTGLRAHRPVLEPSLPAQQAGVVGAEAASGLSPADVSTFLTWQASELHVFKNLLAERFHGYHLSLHFLGSRHFQVLLK